MGDIGTGETAGAVDEAGAAGVAGAPGAGEAGEAAGAGEAVSARARPLEDRTSRRIQLALWACFGIPILLLVASYAWLALDHGTLRLWSVVVHESGRYTLGETVLYFSHFLREVPIVLGYALFLLGISGGISPRPFGCEAGDADATPGADEKRVDRARSARRVRGLIGSRPGGRAAALAAGILVAIALFATVAAQGWSSALMDLVQFRTRDDLVGYGTHWRYHWLGMLWFGAAVGVAPAVANRIMGAIVLRPHRLRGHLAWGYFFLLTLVFGLSTDVFLDVRYAGHQAREILTHGPTTLLLGIGLLLLMAGNARNRPKVGGGRRPVRPAVHRALTAFTLLVPPYLAVVTLTGNVMEEGQSALGLGAMIGAHYFEHTLDYLLILLLVAAGLASGSGRSQTSLQE